MLDIIILILVVATLSVSGIVLLYYYYFKSDEKEEPEEAIEHGDGIVEFEGKILRRIDDFDRPETDEVKDLRTVNNRVWIFGFVILFMAFANLVLTFGISMTEKYTDNQELLLHHCRNINRHYCHSSDRVAHGGEFAREDRKKNRIKITETIFIPQ